MGRASVRSRRVTMTVAAVSALMLGPDWKALGRGLIPDLSMGDSHQTLRYWYFAVGIFSAMLMVYEVHFYSSGALEEDWTERTYPRTSWSRALVLFSARC